MAGAISRWTFSMARSTDFPRQRAASPSRNSTASNWPVERRKAPGRGRACHRRAAPPLPKSARRASRRFDRRRRRRFSCGTPRDERSKQTSASSISANSIGGREDLPARRIAAHAAAACLQDIRQAICHPLGPVAASGATGSHGLAISVDHRRIGPRVLIRFEQPRSAASRSSAQCAGA